MPVTRKKLVWGALVLLTLLVALIHFRWFYFPIHRPQQIDKSIAVVPFTDISENHDQEWFSDGMTEEILGHLYKIGDWRVASRCMIFPH